MSTQASVASCPLCALPTPEAELAEASWAGPDVEARLTRAHPGWTRPDGACPACIQQALLETLLEKGESAYHRR